jgi:hypothetical protein
LIDLPPGFPGGLEGLEFGGPFARDEFFRDAGATLEEQGLLKELADSGALFLDASDGADFAELGFGEIDRDFHGEIVPQNPVSLKKSMIF